ncbi:MAG: Spy/CpxP family protein refolding chaperone, partial [Hyphomicrobiaceae bacterium]
RKQKLGSFALGLAIASALAVGFAAAANACMPPPLRAEREGGAIAGLTDRDIADLRAGRGWALAMSAEVNGHPGPLHVIELADKLGLTAQQRDRVRKIFEAMKAKAQAVGAKYLSAEKALDEAFKSGTAEAATVAHRVDETEKLRAELRLIHLLAHLETTPLLTPEQIRLYNRLRGEHRSGRAKH